MRLSSVHGHHGRRRTALEAQTVGSTGFPPCCSRGGRLRTCFRRRSGPSTPRPALGAGGFSRLRDADSGRGDWPGHWAVLPRVVLRTPAVAATSLTEQVQRQVFVRSRPWWVQILGVFSPQDLFQDPSE